MVKPREKHDDGSGAIVLQHPDDPIPQPKIVTLDGETLTPEEAEAMADAEAEDADISDLDDDLPA